MAAKFEVILLNQEKGADSRDQSEALANAFAQYCLDFPDAGEVANTREWVSLLGGANGKHLRYLKVERYSKDSEGRLLDPCGVPWVVQTASTPGFRANDPQDPSELQVISKGCEDGLAFDSRTKPAHRQLVQ